MFKSALSWTLWSIMAVYAAMAQAEIKVVKQVLESEPHRVVQNTTLQVLSLLNTGIDPTKDPEKFVETLSTVLDPVVAFDYIARGVMGNYAKHATQQQVKQFSAAFKLGLVNSYGQGIANFGDQELIVVPPEAPLSERQRLVTVVQEIRGNATHQLSYTMAKNRQGQWKMINIVLNGINLGQTFRGQFAATVEKNQGDVEKTINEWGKG